MRIVIGLVFLTLFSCAIKDSCVKLTFDEIATKDVIKLKEAQCYRLVYKIEKDDSNIIIFDFGSRNPDTPKIELNPEDSIHDISDVILSMYSDTGRTNHFLTISRVVAENQGEGLAWCEIEK